MELLSIQSSVAFGHVGNSAAVFPLQRLGIEAWAVNTVHFSNHTGYGEWRGPLLSADDLRAVIQGVEERGALARVSALASRSPLCGTEVRGVLPVFDVTMKTRPRAAGSTLIKLQDQRSCGFP